jgi:hypothetical protein
MEPISETPAEAPKSNRNMIIGVVVALVLCCCCVIFIALGWTFGDQILQSLGF